MAIDEKKLITDAVFESHVIYLSLSLGVPDCERGLLQGLSDRLATARRQAGKLRGSARLRLAGARGRGLLRVPAPPSRLLVNSVSRCLLVDDQSVWAKLGYSLSGFVVNRAALAQALVLDCLSGFLNRVISSGCKVRCVRHWILLLVAGLKFAKVALNYVLLATFKVSTLCQFQKLLSQGQALLFVARRLVKGCQVGLLQFVVLALVCVGHCRYLRFVKVRTLYRRIALLSTYFLTGVKGFVRLLFASIFDL